MKKLILNRLIAILCYIIPIVILLIIYHKSLFKTPETSISFVFITIIGIGAIVIFKALNIWKLVSLKLILIGGILAWLTNTQSNVSVVYVAPILIGAGMFIEEVFVRAWYDKYRLVHQTGGKE